MAKIVDEGMDDILTWYFGNDQSSRGVDSLYLGLYTNNTEPLATATLASGLTELALAGYARIQLLDADFTILNQSATNILKQFLAAEDWGLVYGVFLCNVSSGTAGELIYVDHFVTPENIADTKTHDETAKITGA
jgi:hypothetical protein